MAKPLIKLPSDLSAEIYFDPNRLVVDFRKRDDKKKVGLGTKVLRVVVQCFGWVVEDRFFPAGTAITIGAGKRNTFRIPTRDLPDSHRLIDYGRDGSIELSVNKHFTGVIESEKKLKTLASLMPAGASAPINTLQLKSGTKGCLEHGTMLIYFEEIPDPEKVPPVAIFKSLSDPYFRRWFLISLVLHLLALLVIKLIPAPTKEVELKDLSQFKRVIVQPSNIKPYQAPKGLTTGAATNLRRGSVGQEGEGERAPGPEGRRGAGVPGAGARISNRDIKRTGVLDVFTRSGKSSSLAALIGSGSGVPGEVDKAFNRAARYGLPGEHEVREGKGLTGSGRGGGGRPESMGSGLGTKGRGGGAKGPGLADFGTGRSDTAVSASIDEEEVFIMGNIPKEVIAKIMEDNMGAIRYCYQRQVQVEPSLRGKVTSEFVIGLEGRVTSTRIKKSTLGSPPVEQCIMNVIRRIQFPKPGGGVVEVTYPFSFRVAG